MTLAIVLAAGAQSAMAQKACGTVTGSETDFGKYFSLGSVVRDDEPAETPTAPGQTYTHMRYRLAPEPTADVEWELTLRREDRVVDSVSSHDFSGAPLRSVWTGRIPLAAGDRELTYDFKTGPMPAGWALKLKAMLAMPSGLAHPFYSLQDEQNSRIVRIEAYRNRDWWRHSAAVGMLVSGNSQKAWCCTGTMVAHDLFLTNRHCLAEVATPAEACQNAIIDLSWDGDSASRDLQCDAVIEPSASGAGNPPPDAVILQVRPVRENTRVFPAAFSRKPVQTSHNGAYIIHHPACGKKSLTPKCAITSVDPASGHITHTCDTMTGSSGAAVLDGNGNIVALHREGFQLNAGGDCDKQNKAISAGSLLKAFPDSITQRFRYTD